MKTLGLCLLLLSTCMSFAQGNTTLPRPEPGNVTLPLDEYNRLVELGEKRPKKPEAPPLPYSIKRLDLKLRVEGESVLGSIQMDGEILNKGVTRIPLTRGMTILGVREEGKPVPLKQENGGQVAALTGPADFSLALDAGLALNIETKRASFQVPVPAAGSAQMSLTIPGEHTLVSLQPGLITAQKSEGGHTTIEATLVPGQTSTVWWATREAAAPAEPRETRFLSAIKTLVTVNEAELRLVALADVTVVQGSPSEFVLEVPAGYEFTGATGATLDSAEIQSGALVLKLSDTAQKSHQFLVSMEKGISATKADVPFFGFRKAQRETGEILVEGAGTMELTATEGGNLKRMDVKETNPYLRSLAHYPPQAAFRYHKQPNEVSSLTLEWIRFPDMSVLAAGADSAQVTTLVTPEGKSLTEVKLVVRNQAQPFLKVDLPAGASILSADVAGEKVKPVQGQDGSRVPLLRPGFRPTDAYTVSFVFMHSGTPFAKKGGSELTLPKLDIPINMLEWEVFLPERYKVKDFGGDAMAANLVGPAFVEDAGVQTASVGGYDLGAIGTGEVGGFMTDRSGAAIPGGTVTVTNEDTGVSRMAATNDYGRWTVKGIPSGPVRIRAQASGFKEQEQRVQYDSRNPYRWDSTMQVSGVQETIIVEASSLAVQTDRVDHRRQQREEQRAAQTALNTASSNVYNLQRRVAGVLPVAVEVPKAGMSFRFVRPLVLGEETKVTFNYSSK